MLNLKRYRTLTHEYRLENTSSNNKSSIITILQASVKSSYYTLIFLTILSSLHMITLNNVDNKTLKTLKTFNSRPLVLTCIPFSSVFWTYLLSTKVKRAPKARANFSRKFFRQIRNDPAISPLYPLPPIHTPFWDLTGSAPISKMTFLMEKKTGKPVKTGKVSSL